MPRRSLLIVDCQHSYFSPMQLMAVEKSADEQNFDKMKAVYDACLDEEKIKEHGAEPLMQVLDEIKQAYPVEALGKSDAGTRDAIALLAKYGISALVASGTSADDRDPDTVVISVSAPWSFGLPSKERYEDDKLVEKYRAVTIQVLSALYPDQNKDTFAKIVDLERRLAAASPSTEDREDVTKYYNPMKIEDAAGLTPEIDLEELLARLAPEKAQIERVIVMSPDYQKELSSIISETDREVLQGYFVWKAAQSFSGYVETDAVKPYKRFMNELAGKVREVCINYRYT
jgi:endothelin-converting enzyme